VWTIDPIDGTTNFVKGNPIFATLIACSVDGQDLVGVVSAPALGTPMGRRRRSGRGRTGAITVSDVASSRRPRSPSAVSPTSRNGRPGSSPRSGGDARQRGYGDFWAYCLLAAGSTDMVVEGRLNPWDLAAVRAVVEAAGGRVTDLDGVGRSDGGSAVASNGHLHDELLALIGRTGVPDGTGDRAG
jgi:histidinol-phosphatase